MRVLVTGAAGFIGSHIAETMRAAGHDVRGMDSLAPAVHSGRPDHVTGDLVVGDVRDPAAVNEALAGTDAVCHQAAMVGLGVDLSDLPGYADVNVTGTAVLLEAMGRHGIPRLVFASSMVVYGEGAYDCATHGRVRPAPRHPGDLAAGRFEPRCPQCAQPLSTATVTEDAPLDPRNAYAASKVGQEHLAASWARMTGGAAVGLRYHNVYGPRMPRDTPYSGVAAIFRSCLENGVPPRVFEDGGQRRDFVHVRDVARANLLALQAVDRAVAGTGLGDDPRRRDRRAAVLQRRQRRAAYGGRDGRRAGRGVRRRLEPVVTGEYRLGDVRHVVASPAAAGRDLGFRAQDRVRRGHDRVRQRRPARARAGCSRPDVGRPGFGTGAPDGRSPRRGRGNRGAMCGRSREPGTQTLTHAERGGPGLIGASANPAESCCVNEGRERSTARRSDRRDGECDYGRTACWMFGVITMHGEVAVAGIQVPDLVHICVRVIVLSVVVTFLGIGLLRRLAARSVGLMLTIVVGVSAICSLLGVGVIAWLMMGYRL